jgi:hypothetical protein
MKKAPWDHIEKYRIKEGEYRSYFGETFGAFTIPYNRVFLKAIASNGDYKKSKLGKEYAWEHVSVSLLYRCPYWEEMCYVKDLFWNEDEAVIQFHPAKDQYVNCHPYTLHLWRPLLKKLPLPPSAMV